MLRQEELNAKVKELREYTRLKEDAEAQIDALKDEIKAEMVVRNTDMIVGDDWKVTYKSVKSNQFDSKQFKKDYADIYALYCNSKETRRFILA